MALPFTCKSPPANHMNHNHRHHHSHSLSIHLTDTSRPVSVNCQHPPTAAPSADCNSAWKNLVENTTAASLSPCITDVSDTKTFYSAIQVTDICSDSDESIKIQDISPGPKDMTTSDSGNSAKRPGDKPDQTQKPKPSSSRASSTSRRAPRSPSSSSTAGASSRKERRRTASIKTQNPASPSSRNNSIQMSPQKRDELLALHRNSCQLFKEVGTAVDPLVGSSAASHDGHSLNLQSNTASPAVSPVLLSQRSHSFPVGFIHDGDISEEDLLSVRRFRRMSNVHSEPDPAARDPSDQTPYDHVPATVIDWTSPSTRRREYEAIDRSNRGLRRIWRRITPRCLHSSDSRRTPFFETGEDGKPNYEGSVRRFRMDIPDEKEELGQSSSLASACPKLENRKWSCF